jgi:2-oxoglutarate dehydrogenase E1 component
VVFTPKSLLRLPQAASRLADLASGEFRFVIDDPAVAHRDRITRVVFCSGKVYYDLAAGADPAAADRPAIVRVEKLYSFPERALQAVLAGYPALREAIWCQEEPRNMGAWSFVAPRLGALLPDGVPLRYVGRPDRASPAEGYHEAHALEQRRIVGEAVSKGEQG